MYCTKCGAQITEGSNFCSKCGAAVDQSAAQSQPSSAQPQPVQTVSVTPTSSFSIVSLVTGILGLFINPLSILAIIFGALGISQTNKNPNLKGHGMAVAGLVLGIVVVVIWIIIIIWFSTVFWWLAAI
jgi:uncharacterized membrane protein YvbJ